MATETDKVNTGALATLVAVGAFAMIGICLSLVALVRDQLESEHTLKDVAADASYRELKQQQIVKLESGQTIQAAMAAVVSEYAKNPAAATPVTAAGGTSGSTAAVGSAEPAPGPAPSAAPATNPASAGAGAVAPK